MVPAPEATSYERILESTTTVEYEYFYTGDKLTMMTVDDTEIWFYYDASGTPYALKFQDEYFYYATNAQGDVTAILNSSGNEVGTYAYDAWGKPTTAIAYHVVAVINPLRYRGYVYDNETELYYLQSRYYNPEVGRFLNPDIYTSTGQGLLGNNMHTYCLNNPVRYKDVSGFTAVDCFDTDGDTVDPDDDATSGGGAGGCGVLGVVYSVINVVATVVESASPGLQMASGMGGNGIALTASISTAGYNPPAVCFVAGTMVQTEDGLAAIEDIEVGDYVWAWDEETGDVALKAVVETYVNETTELIHVFVNGEEIVSTPTHPFYSPVKGWTDAVHLRAGDILVLVNGEYVVVEKVQHEILEAPVTVYNFHVEDYHT